MPAEPHDVLSVALEDTRELHIVSTHDGGGHPLAQTQSPHAIPRRYRYDHSPAIHDAKRIGGRDNALALQKMGIDVAEFSLDYAKLL